MKHTAGKIGVKHFRLRDSSDLDDIPRISELLIGVALH